MKWSGMKWLALISPLERLGHGPIEVRDKRKHLVAQVVDGAKVTAAQQLAHQDAPPDLDLVHPRGVFGRVVEHDRVTRITEECGPRGFRAEHTTHVLPTQIGGAAG